MTCITCLLPTEPNESTGKSPRAAFGHLAEVLLDRWPGWRDRMPGNPVKAQQVVHGQVSLSPNQTHAIVSASDVVACGLPRLHFKVVEQLSTEPTPALAKFAKLVA